MELGYITFSAEEQQLVHNVLQQINQGAIDELGLGRIRDAFSDLMFPGMSTLHSKSKYFILLPTLYNQLAQTNITDRKQISSLIRQWEINMTKSLMNGNDPNKHEGITGSSKIKEGSFVKITPTNIYLSSLKFFGLVSDKMNLPDLILQQSRINHEAMAKGRRSKADENPDDNDNTTGISSNFVSFPGYDFSKESFINLQLTSYEAQILKDRIIRKCRDGNNGKDNLYSYLLRNDSINIKDDFFEMKNVIAWFPDDLRKVYDMAYDFSKWAHLMNTYYRYAFYIETDNDDARNTQKSHIDEILTKKGYPTKERIAEILNFVSPMFKDVNGLCKFCSDASECLENPSKEEQLISLIANREKKIKHSHYKIGNERYKNTDYTGPPGYYTYRWNEIVYSMINDIRNPQP